MNAQLHVKALLGLVLLLVPPAIWTVHAAGHSDAKQVQTHSVKTLK